MSTPSPRITSEERGRQAEWARRPERSNMAMLRLMTWISLRLGRPVARLVLYPIAAYFLLFSPTARRASRLYLRRALGYEPGWRELFRHFLSFACTVHDRVYLINERFDLFDIRVHGEQALRSVLEEGRGAFLLGAHLGSFEAVRAVGRRQPGRTGADDGNLLAPGLDRWHLTGR